MDKKYEFMFRQRMSLDTHNRTNSGLFRWFNSKAYKKLERQRKLSKKDMDEWQRLVEEIRAWDRKGHNFNVTNKTLPHRNIRTKTQFIHSLMKRYKISRRR